MPSEVPYEVVYLGLMLLLVGVGGLITSVIIQAGRQE
jgi:hypothetical protein